MSRKTVFLGMSGGVDSAVSAALLVEQGYRVVGVYMKNWSKDLPGMKCPWAEDLADAKRVAVKLGIDFLVFDFEKEYRELVVEDMLRGIRAGTTPNPDVMCNQEIKFGLFYKRAKKMGADLVATGHYARVSEGRLLKAEDEGKDQTYFLYRVPREVLFDVLFPVGELKKKRVKEIAREKGFFVAEKKESMGVCFVGEVGMEEFLAEYIEEKRGEIVEEESGRIIGEHRGAWLYTIGQRHGLNLGGGWPFYVVGKDMVLNRVYVSKNLNHRGLFVTEIKLRDELWRGKPEGEVEVRVRHLGKLVKARYEKGVVRLKEEIKRPAAGQSVVGYRGEECLGGGVVEK